MTDDRPEMGDTTKLKNDTPESPDGQAHTSQRELDRSLVGGVMWTAGARWMGQLLSWAVLFIVARILSPSDFGLVGMAAVYLSLAQGIGEFGFGSALVTLRDLTENQIRQINMISALSGFAAFGLSCLVAYPLGLFFRAPKLPAVVVVMSLAFLFSGFRTVPYSLLQRDLRFKLLSFIDTGQAVVQAVTTLIFALLGFGYWALVLGNVTGTAAVTGLSVLSEPRGFSRPYLSSIQHAVRFGWHILVSRTAWTLYSNADFIVAGRMLGEAPLGAYTIAWNLATLPSEKISALIGRVTPSVFSAAQTDLPALRRYVTKITEALSLLTMPADVGLALVAVEFVPIALGKKWHGAIAPLELLAIYGAVRSIAPVLSQVLQALKQTRILMWQSLLGLVVFPTGFVIGSRWGTAGIAWGWVLLSPIVLFPLYWYAFRHMEMPAGEYFGAVKPALAGTLGMVAVVGVLRWTMPAELSIYLRLGVEVVAGAAAYLLVLLIFHRDRLRSFLRLAKVLGRGAEAEG